MATPTESASVGAVGALLLAAVRQVASGFQDAAHIGRRDTILFRLWLAFLAVLAAGAYLFGAAGLLNLMADA